MGSVFDNQGVKELMLLHYCQGWSWVHVVSPFVFWTLNNLRDEGGANHPCRKRKRAFGPGRLIFHI